MTEPTGTGSAEAGPACLAKPADSSGRARRPRDGWFVLFSFIALLAVIFICVPVPGSETFWPASLFPLVVLLPGLAVGRRRLHGIGRPGFRLLPGMPAAPVLGVRAALASRGIITVGGLPTLALPIRRPVLPASLTQSGASPFGPVPAP